MKYRSQRGQALLEFALILPVILLLLLGGADLLMAYSARQNLNYVAQETAMCAAMGVNPQCASPLTYAQSLAQGMGMNQSNIGATQTMSGTCTNPALCVQITATYTFDPIFPVFLPTINLTSVAQYSKPSGGPTPP